MSLGEPLSLEKHPCNSSIPLIRQEMIPGALVKCMDLFLVLGEYICAFYYEDI